MKEELSVTLKDIEKMTPNKVDELVSKKTKEILVNIQNCTNKIQKAKKAAKHAESMETGVFLGRGKRTAAKATATAKALMNTNEAVSELSNIVKESIAFTCLSMAFAKKMTDSIAQMMAEGFEDSNGNYITLSNDAKEQGEIILKQAKNYLNSQLQINELEARQKEQEIIDKQQDELIAKNSERLDEKEKIDELQTQRLEELGALLSNKDLVDQKQEEAILKNSEAVKILFEYTKQKEELDKKQSEQIEQLINKNKVNVINLLSLGLSIISIGLCIYTIFIR